MTIHHATATWLPINASIQNFLVLGCKYPNTSLGLRDTVLRCWKMLVYLGALSAQQASRLFRFLTWSRGLLRWTQISARSSRPTMKQSIFGQKWNCRMRGRHVSCIRPADHVVWHPKNLTCGSWGPHVPPFRIKIQTGQSREQWNVIHCTLLLSGTHPRPLNKDTRLIFWNKSLVSQNHTVQKPWRVRKRGSLA